jgi:hypothetical protein
MIPTAPRTPHSYVLRALALLAILVGVLVLIADLVLAMRTGWALKSIFDVVRSGFMLAMFGVLWRVFSRRIKEE